MRPHPGILAVALAATAAGTAHAQSSPAGRTTLEARVVPATGSGPYVPLTLGPGEPMTVRGELAAARPGRAARRRSLLYFAQLSDFQLSDEESPSRVEFLDRSNPLFGAAHRPQEALLPHTVSASVRQVNLHTRSPFRAKGGRARLAMSILTGDNADNNQRNEAEWVRTLLDGGRLDPGSGRADAEALQGQGCPSTAGALAEEAPRYTGVQDADDAGANPDFYDPDQPAGLYADFPTYPGLMDRAQRPFRVGGLVVPSYVAVGNHDGLVQGNQAATATTNSLARGCLKPLRVPPLDGGDPAGALQASLSGPSLDASLIVPPDPRRQQVTKAQYRALFAQGAQSDGHGLSLVDREELDASAGAATYYDFSPAAGVRFIALDTISTAGIAGPSSDGNVDDPEFRWLARELEAAERADELVVVFSHHGPTSLTASQADEAAGSCDDPQHPSNPGCDADPRPSTPIRLGEDVVQLLLEHPHVVAWVAGHSHVNDVAFHQAADGPSGFWVVRTSAEADFPHQDRLIDLMDNRDGTLSLMSVLLDNGAPAAAVAGGTPADGLSVPQLASIARTLGYNDPDGDPNAVGRPEDRNVELLVRDPRRGVAGRRTVTVRPARITSGRRTTVRVRVRNGARPIRRAAVRTGRARGRTDARGRARLRVRFDKPGLRTVRSGSARAPLIVVRR